MVIKADRTDIEKIWDDSCNRFQIISPTMTLGQFGSGEDASISLAQEHNCTILINDVRPLNFARACGLSTVSVPTFVVTLFVDGVIHRSAVEAKLNSIQYNTSPTLLDEARRAIALF